MGYLAAWLEPDRRVVYGYRFGRGCESLDSVLHACPQFWPWEAGAELAISYVGVEFHRLR